MEKTYISPYTCILDIEMEGVLCASPEYPASRNFDSLEDYNPSEGAW